MILGHQSQTGWEISDIFESTIIEKKCVKMVAKIGIELEGHLIDNYGTLSNRASEVVGSPENNGDIMPELSRTMWETVAPPKSELSEIYSSFEERLKILKEITDTLGLRSIPTSSLHNESEVESRDSERPRGMRKRIILGDYLRNLEHHLTGTHIHVDILEGSEKGYKQYLLMQAMDPVFSFMSSSPFFFGANHKKDYRVDVYRNEVFRDMPLQGQLLDYPESLAATFDRQKACYHSFMEILRANNLDAEGLDELNCIWGPLRLTGFGTIESRAADSNKLSNVIALAALYQGITEYIDNENPRVAINTDSNYAANRLFLPKNGEIIIPSYEQLKRFERVGIEEGLENNELRDYLSNIVETCSRGLEDNKYLEPFVRMIDSRRNFSDDIISYAKKEGLEKYSRINGAAAKELRSYIANCYERDLLD